VLTSRSFLLTALSAASLAGCGWFNNTPAGLVAGSVLFNGNPAAGKRVSLYNSDGTPQVGNNGSGETVTDAIGRFAFTGVPTGRYHVRYDSVGDRPGAFPNEVLKWLTPDFALSSGSGMTLQGFDVAYNGLLYPQDGMALAVGATTPIPFHWSTHLQARQYRLHVQGGGGFDWLSAWSSNPTANFQSTIAPGSYTWQVDIDGGDRGTGETVTRPIDLSPPTNTGS
jgi:hypothetical protein